MPSRVCLFLAALTLLPPPDPARAQSERARQPKDDRELHELVEYHDLVAAFRTGDDASAAAIAAWPGKRILAVIALAPPAAPGLPAWDPGQFKASAMMHTAAAFRLLDTSGPGDAALLHLEAGTALLRRGGDGVHDFVGPWHTAITQRLLAGALLAPLEAFLAHAREQFPREPSILFLGGLFFEYAAGRPSLEDLAPSPERMSQSGVEQAFERTSRRRAERLDDAARMYGFALSANPQNAEALLHRARVEMLRAREADAMRLFQEVDAAAPARADLRYLAALFAGGLHERGGRFEDAAAAYRRAGSIVPGAQSARVALSEALRRSGRTDESIQILRDAVAARRPPVVDPWWTYILEGADATAARLTRLLAEARR